MKCPLIFSTLFYTILDFHSGCGPANSFWSSKKNHSISCLKTTLLSPCSASQSAFFIATASWKVKVSQSCPTLRDPMAYTVYGILQARILEWVAFPFSWGSSQLRDWTQASYTVQADSLPAEPQDKPKNTGAYPIPSPADLPLSCIADRFFTNWAIREATDPV